MKIEVCGPGCWRCHATRDNVLKALQELGLKEGKDATVTMINDFKVMATKGVMFTPALFIDGVKVVEGGIPTTEEIKQWIKEKA